VHVQYLKYGCIETKSLSLLILPYPFVVMHHFKTLHHILQTKPGTSFSARGCCRAKSFLQFNFYSFYLRWKRCLLPSRGGTGGRFDIRSSTFDAPNTRRAEIFTKSKLSSFTSCREFKMNGNSCISRELHHNSTLRRKKRRCFHVWYNAMPPKSGSY